METIGDTTDPQGTLRPNLPPEPITGTQFDPMPHTDFQHRTDLPNTVDPMQPLQIWDLFFTEEMMDILVRNTNSAGPYWTRVGPRQAKLPVWQDVTITELYTYFAILIYMALHIENKIAQYWACANGRRPRHEPVQNAMSRDRFSQIHTAFHIAKKGQDIWEMV